MGVDSKTKELVKCMCTSARLARKSNEHVFDPSVVPAGCRLPITNLETGLWGFVCAKSSKATQIANRVVFHWPLLDNQAAARVEGKIRKHCLPEAHSELPRLDPSRCFVDLLLTRLDEEEPTDSQGPASTLTKGS